VERAAAGEDVVIALAGQPVAVVIGIDRYRPKRELGFAKESFIIPSFEAFNAPLDDETLDYFSGKAGR
jgi:antitoxin (DNA-binding transcriptional repressor) of toxin-antitoxin stability system